MAVTSSAVTPVVLQCLSRHKGRLWLVHVLERVESIGSFVAVRASGSVRVTVRCLKVLQGAEIVAWVWSSFTFCDLREVPVLTALRGVGARPGSTVPVFSF